MNNLERVLAEGSKELCDAGLEGKCPTLIVGEVGAVDFPVRLDFVWAFSVLMHMTDAIVERTVAFAARQIRWVAPSTPMSAPTRGAPTAIGRAFPSHRAHSPSTRRSARGMAS
jgi:hypothetical protein